MGAVPSRWRRADRRPPPRGSRGRRKPHRRASGRRGRRQRPVRALRKADDGDASRIDVGLTGEKGERSEGVGSKLREIDAAGLLEPAGRKLVDEQRGNIRRRRAWLRSRDGWTADRGTNAGARPPETARPRPASPNSPNRLAGSAVELDHPFARRPGRRDWGQNHQQGERRQEGQGVKDGLRPGAMSEPSPKRPQGVNRRASPTWETRQAAGRPAPCGPSGSLLRPIRNPLWTH